MMEYSKYRDSGIPWIGKIPAHWNILRGKNKPQFTPHVDTGDYVIIVNADKIKVTGKKSPRRRFYCFNERNWLSRG